jgi:hypothetical protein
MKKTCILLFFILSPLFWRGAGGEAFAQSLCKKGTWMIGLNPVNYSFANNNKSEQYVGGKQFSGDTVKFSGIAFALNAGIGYFIKDNICVGVGFGSNLSPGTYPVSLVLPTQLFVRYYLFQQIRNFSFARQDNMRRYAFFMEGAINGGYAAYKGTFFEKTIDYSYGGKLALGYTYMFNKHFAFEVMGMYNYFTAQQTANNSNPTLSTKDIQIQSGFNALFGIQGYF